MEALRLIWDETFTKYDFGDAHPMSPIRLELTARLVRDLGLLAHAGVHVHGVDPVGDEILMTVHDPGFVEAVKAASVRPPRLDEAHGLGTEDVPVFEGMHEASARIVGGTLDLARAVWQREAAHGVNFAGGMHHAMPDHASGFCVYNDSAVAIRALLDEGAERVCYIDIDVHHGDGVERVFWDDPRVLTISLHETGRVLFPGTGFPGDFGGPAAPGSVVNLAFPPGTSDAPWLRGFHAVVPQLVRAFDPQILVTQHGCDSHSLDPLAHMVLSLDCQVESYRVLHELAHEVCDGRWVAVGGGGYELVDVVPRAWAHLVGIAAHHPVPPETLVPSAWRDYVEQRFGRQAPRRMTDGKDVSYRPWTAGHDPEDAVDHAVLSTRKAVFPLHGLDPWSD
ncbi:MAG: acetoin utilization protein AcuC [Actinomycetota bacterium]|nr:acetoin utilization protein AcuC [Actinomycetota bacterium]